MIKILSEDINNEIKTDDDVINLYNNIYKKISSEYESVINDMIYSISHMKKQAPKEWMALEIGGWNMHNETLIIPDDEDEKNELIDALLNINKRDDYDLRVDLEKFLASRFLID